MHSSLLLKTCLSTKREVVCGLPRRVGGPAGMLGLSGVGGFFGLGRCADRSLAIVLNRVNG